MIANVLEYCCCCFQPAWNSDIIPSHWDFEHTLLLLVGLKFFRTSKSGREKRTGFVK